MKRFFAQYAMWTDRLQFGMMVYERDAGGKMQGYVARLTLEPHKEGDHIAEPTAMLTKDEAQELIDALWMAGVRPSSGEGNAGQLGATERHLADMRKLVFKTETLTRSIE